jgi:hypothetical protein
VVITTALAGLKTPKLTASTSPATLLPDGTASSTVWSVDVQENYIDAFRSATQFSPLGSTNGVRVSLQFTGIPAGVTLGGCSVSAIATDNASNTSISPGFPFIVGGVQIITSAANRVDLDWAGQPSLTQLETLRFTCTTISVSPQASLPLNLGSIGVQATLAPTGSAFANDGSILTDPNFGQIPRYATSLLPVTPLTIVAIVPFSSRRHGQITSQD